jgi:hypothetical protein
VRVSVSAWELAQVTAGAGREGMAAAAWLGEIGVRAAARRGDTAAAAPGECMQELMVAHAGLMDLRRILRNVGGNLNDVARHANSTGTLAAETGRVRDLVARVVLRVDAAVAELGGLMALARQSQLAGRAPRRRGRRR